MNEQKVLSKGATDMVKAINLLKSSTTGLEEMKNELISIDYDLTAKRAELEKLNIELDERERSRLVEIDIKAKERIVQHIDNFLAETNRISVTKDRYDYLFNLGADFDKKLNEKLNAETSKIRAEFNNTLNLKESDFKFREAENAATINSLTSQLASARNEAKVWQDQLTSEREASIERAKASSIGSVNIASK